MIYICCVALRPLIYFETNLMIVPGILVCGRFLISVCIYCVESFAHIESYSD